MANTSTMYTFNVQLADSDRHVYEDLKIAAAMHPSESKDYMAMRVLAFCLEYEEGLTFSKGLGDPEEPAIWTKHLDGQIKTWIDIGVPEAIRLHRAAKLSGRVAVYAHRNPANLFKQASGTRIHRGNEIRIITCTGDFVATFGSNLDRRTSFSLSVAEKHLYLTMNGATLESQIVEAPLQQ